MEGKREQEIGNRDLHGIFAHIFFAESRNMNLQGDREKAAYFRTPLLINLQL